MSRYERGFSLSLPPAAVLRICQAAAAKTGWHISSQHEAGLVCNEIPKGLSSFTNPVQVEIRLTGSKDGPTNLTLKGSNFGFGPMQSNHVKKQVDALKEEITMSAGDPSVTGSVPEPSTLKPSTNPEGFAQTMNANRHPDFPPSKSKTVWDRIKEASERIIQAGVSNLQHRSFIDSLLQMAPPQAYLMLKQKIEGLDDQGMNDFNVALAGMIGEAQQAIQQAGSSSSWGPCIEDEIAQSMAEIESGFPSRNAASQAQLYLQDLSAIAYYADQLYREKLERTRQTSSFNINVGEAHPSYSDTPGYGPSGGQQPLESTGQVSKPATDLSQIDRMLENMVKTGHLDPALMQQLSALNDPDVMEKVTAKLQELGAQEVSSPSLNIAGYYRPGSGKYQLKWPLSASLPLPLPFEQLDRETQFHVLFAEWSRREQEGSLALDAGDMPRAQGIFLECLSRADQLEVAELKRRGYEGLMRVAQKLGDRQAERKWIDAALSSQPGEKDRNTATQLSQFGLQRQRAMLDFEEGRLPDSEAALSHLIRSLEDLNEAAACYELGRTLLDHATVLRFSNRWPEALDDLNRCEKAAQPLASVPSRSLLVNVYQQRAKIYETLWQFSDSEAERETARNNAHADLDQLKKMGFTNWWIEETAADLAYRERDWETAAQGYRRVAQELSREGWARGAAASRLRAGRAYLEQGSLSEAELDITAALTFFDQYGPTDLLATAKIQAARLRVAHGDADSAWELACSSLNLVEASIRQFRSLFDQQRFLLDKLTYYQDAFAIGLAKGGIEGRWRTWTIAERSKSFYLCQLVANADVRFFDDVGPEQIDQLRKMEMELDDCELTLGRLQSHGFDSERRSEMEDRRQRISEAKLDLQGKMMKANPRWAAFKVPPPLDLATEIKRLGSSWVPISYFWQSQAEGATLHIFFTGNDGAPHHLATVWTRGELAQLDHTRESLQGRVPPTMKIFPDGLVDRVLPPIISEVLKPGQSLLISPHDRLRCIPLHVLQIRPGERLIDLYPVQYIPTLALLPLTNPAERSGGVLLMGCEQDGFGSKPLKEVADELKALNQLWSARRFGMVTECLIPDDGSPEQSGLPLEKWQDYDILHLACHGHFPEDRPFDAALRLGKEAMRTSEFFNSRLKATLMSLSACSLGRQTRKHSGINFVGDEWVGLYLPLFYAGVHTVLVSLWDANSKVAAHFMKAFHSILSQGSSPAEAFRQAIHSMSSTPALLWANWYLVGFPRRQSSE